jgi:arginine:pyruvate transaminase
MSMTLSNRITDLLPGGEDGWELFLKSRRMKAAGVPVVELTIGEHDIPTDPAILAAMDASARGGHTGYASVPGTPALRAAVAERTERMTGVPTRPENVLITPGGQAALFAAHIAVLDAGDTAAFIDPFYATYPGTIRGAGGVPRAVPTLAEEGFAPGAQALAEGLRGAASLLVNTPNNPTGAVYDAATLARIAQAVQAAGCWLISDEVYDGQVWEGTHRSPRAVPGMAERTLVIGSMSKSFAMTGSRIGWIVGPQEAISYLTDLATHTTYGVPGFIQDAANFALRAGPQLEARVAEPFSRRRALALRMLEGQTSVGHVPSGGAMYLMLDIRATGLSGEDFAESLLERHHVAVMPGESFGQAAAGHLRVALTVDDATLQAALATLIAHAEALSRETANAR